MQIYRRENNWPDDQLDLCSTCLFCHAVFFTAKGFPRKPEVKYTNQLKQRKPSSETAGWRNPYGKYGL
jgi:hypothetical protein